MSVYNRMFDLDRDGKLDASERALEYMNFRAITGEDDNFDNDELGFEENDYDEEDDF